MEIRQIVSIGSILLVKVIIPVGLVTYQCFLMETESTVSGKVGGESYMSEFLVFVTVEMFKIIQKERIKNRGGEEEEGERDRKVYN